MKEEYRKIEGFDNYQISNLGNVKNIKTGRILKGGKGKRGYLNVVLCKQGKCKTCLIHKLVAMAFLGHKPSGMKIVVDHINNIKTDNRLSNIQITTSRHNSSKDRKGYSSQYIGVYLDKSCNKWKSSIYIKGKRKHLGYFTDEYKAHLEYQKALNNIN